MHLDNFDLNLLVALDALLTEKHVTRASEKLCVSQPAMSAALARLRAYFDDALLERVGTGLELTPRAADLAKEVRDIIFRIRTTLRSEPTFDPSTGQRDFRLLMSDYTASVFMPMVTRRLLQEAPHVRCQVEHLSRASLTEVDHGLADFCITVQERELFQDGEATSTLSAEPLFSDDFVLAVDGNSHPPDERIGLEEFLRLPYVEIRFTHAVFSVVDAAIRRQKLPLKAAAVTSSFAAAAYLIPQTPMTAILPRRLAEHMGGPLGLIVKAAPIPLPQLCETLVWHARSDADPAHRWFRGFLHSVADEFQAQRQTNVSELSEPT